MGFNENDFLSVVGMAVENRAISQLESPPPTYEESCMKGQTTEFLEGVWERMPCVSEQEGRSTPNTPSPQQIARNVDDVDDVIYDIPDFMRHNVFACLCCCWPIGLIGIIFSMLCDYAKSKGKRKQAKCLSATAGALFAISTFCGVGFIVVGFGLHFK